MKLSQSRESGPHAIFSLIEGEWNGPTTTWFEPGTVGDVSPMAGKFSVILGGRFLMHEYRGSMGGEPFEGVAIYGFDLATQKFQSAWVDSFHMSTGIMFSEGGPGERIIVSGSYDAGGPDVPRWGWRTEIDVLDNNNIVITAYNITPEGEEAKATETRYSRTT